MKRPDVTPCPGCGRAFRPLRRDDGAVYFAPHVRSLHDPARAWCDGTPPAGARCRPLTARDFETLRDLDGAVCGRDGGSWVRPMDVGAWDGSHHSATLAKLVRRGLARSQTLKAPWGSRGSKLYRITAAGQRALAEWRAARKAGAQ